MTAILLLLALGTLPVASAAVLPVPHSVSSVAGVLDTILTIEPAIHTTSAGTTLVTRALNGTIPGPTLRVKPGDTVRIHFQNKLADQGIPHEPNELSACDQSNLHYHGLHVSEELPSLDATVVVMPGESRRYETHIVADHMPGTHWLHPHRHGSTSLQVGGGASTAFIVDDPPGSLPSQVEGAPEVLLVLMQMDLDKLGKVVKASGDKLFSSKGAEGSFLLVNGEQQPTIEITPGQWTRFRLVYAGWLGGDLDFAVHGCEVILLAKDGIYIRDFPRKIAVAPVAPGGRADVMVRCMEPKAKYTVTGWAGKGGKGAVGGGGGKAVEVATIATRGGPVAACSDFDKWTPEYPPYLTDLRKSEADAGCSCTTDLGGKGGKARTVNGRTYEPGVVLHETFVGAVVERKILAAKHPYHQHLFPFQLVSGFDDDEYHRLGDWHDTVQGEGVVRYQAADVGGAVMVHCHILSHEDQGMMAIEMAHPPSSAQGCVCGSISESWQLSVSVSVAWWVGAGVVLFAVGLHHFRQGTAGVQAVV